jgi:hypothetical protein
MPWLTHRGIERRRFNWRATEDDAERVTDGIGDDAAAGACGAQSVALVRLVSVGSEALLTNALSPRAERIFWRS